MVVFSVLVKKFSLTSPQIEFPCSGMDSVMENAHQQTGYLIKEHLLELADLCPGCQQRFFRPG